MIGERCNFLNVERKNPDRWVAFSEVNNINRFYLEGKLESICTEDEYRKENERLKREGKRVYWYKTRNKKQIETNIIL